MNKKSTSEIMRSVHSKGTAPELLLRRELRSSRFRFKYNSSKLPGKPDIVLPSNKMAIFIDGDYWHGNQWHNRGYASIEDQFQSIATKDYWISKIKGNMARDLKVTTNLLDEGWKVLRIWESDLVLDPSRYAEIIVEHARNGTKTSSFKALPKRTFAEFFAGIGLMRMGLERSGWSLKFANDIDPLKFEMYSEQFENADRHFIIKDIHSLKAADIPEVTLATASFPCTDLSLAGRRMGLEARQSSSYWGFIRIIKEMGVNKPPLILLENVLGFITSKNGNDFAKALGALNNLGYSVDAFVLNAAHFVPQSRQRLFVVGVLKENIKNQPPFEEINDSIMQDGLRPNILMKFIYAHRNITWELRHLPAPPNMNKTLDDLLEDPNEVANKWWDNKRVSYLLSQMSHRHRKMADYMISSNKIHYGTVFRRVRNGKSMAELRTDGIAGCLRTPKGGSAKQIIFMAGRGKYAARLMTPKEYARLMGANNYKISVPDDQAYFGFGDAVCVPAIEWIARNYLDIAVNEQLRGKMLG
jgi:DNA (cytosine-5)-methyltransferase 1